MNFLNSNDINYDTVCLSGGGIKGFSFIGVMEYLENNYNFNISKINNWVGTSAGSITSYFYTLGYTTQEIKRFIIEFDFNKMEPNICVNQFIENCGIDNGNKMIFLFSQFLEYKFNMKDITFIQLYNMTKKKLTIIGTNYTLNKEEVFNYIETPNMSVLLAIRISISVPILFTPVKYNGYIYVDGCLVNGFPLNHCDPNKTLGIYIKNSNNNDLYLPEFFKNCISILVDTVAEKHIINNNNVIIIKSTTSDVVKFCMTKEEKTKLINTGIEYAKQYFENNIQFICREILNNIINKVNANNSN